MKNSNLKLKEVTITFYPDDSKPVSLVCEIAQSFSAKLKGLMNRPTLPKNKGMFFPFRLSWIKTFWMKNVLIPLDIIFVNKNLKILNICEANVKKGIIPESCISKGLCKYVIECNMGFCKEHKITAGSKISIESLDN